MPRRRKSRVWKPRPSPATRARILATIRTLLADPDSHQWTHGYAVHPQLLRDVPGLNLKLSTLYHYLKQLADSGELRRVYRGVYALPEPVR